MTFVKGQRVRIVNSDKYTGQYGTVDKALPKNVDVTLDGGRKVRFDPYFLSAELGAVVKEVPIPDLPPPPGAVVTTDDARVTGHYVVIGEAFRRGTQCVKIAKLGGDDGRYWTMPLARCTVVDVAGIVARN